MFDHMRFVKHPAIVQIRGNLERVDEIMRVIERHGEEFEVERVKEGLNVYFSDVNVARWVVSKLNRIFKADVKMSTKYAGLRRGRVRVLFVYRLRID